MGVVLPRGCALCSPERLSHGSLVVQSGALVRRANWRVSATQPSSTSTLVEWNYREYEALTPNQIHEKGPGWLIFRDHWPGGEMPEQVGEGRIR
jgi:hypothetical protein